MEEKRIKEQGRCQILVRMERALSELLRTSNASGFGLFLHFGMFQYTWDILGMGPKSGHDMLIYVSHTHYTPSLWVTLYNIFSMPVTCHTRSDVASSTCGVVLVLNFQHVCSSWPGHSPAWRRPQCRGSFCAKVVLRAAKHLLWMEKGQGGVRVVAYWCLN